MHFNTHPYIYHVCHINIHDIDIWNGMENMHIALLLLFYAVLYTICHVYVSVAIYIISISFLMLFHAYPYIYHVCTINIHDITICDVMKVMHIALLLLFYAVSYTICHVYVPDASHLVSIFFLMHFNTYPYIYHIIHLLTQAF